MISICAAGIFRLRSIAAAILILFSGSVTFALLGTPFGHSYGYNLAWLRAFEAAQAQGVLYPRHLPELMFGLGGLDFYFYGPLPFFLAAGPVAWLCFDCSAQMVFGLSGGIWWSASMLAFWPLARRFAARLPAALACLIYGFLPYHLSVDWAIRQAAGEFAAYAFVPLIALGQYDMVHRGKGGVALPIGLAGLILCHLPTTLLAVHVFGLIALVWAALHPQLALPRLILLTGLALVGVALAAFYWLPALLLVGDVSPDALFTQTLNPAAWLYLGVDILPAGRMSALIALAMLATLATAFLALTCISRAKRAEQLALWVALPVALCLALNTVATSWLWEHWVIGRVQFPFRLMVFADLSAALAASVLIGAWPQRRLRPLGGLGVLAVAIIAGLGLSIPRLLQGIARTGDAPRMLAAPEYLPPHIFSEVAARAEALGYDAWAYPRIIQGNLEKVLDGTVNSETLEIQPARWLLTPDTTGPVLLPVPYWRHMQAITADGDAIALRPLGSWGLTGLDVPYNRPVIEIRIARHWSETWGVILSVLGFGALGAIVFRKMQARISYQRTPLAIREDR